MTEQSPPSPEQPHGQQPPYGGQPPYPAQPGYYPPQQPPKKSNTWKWVLGIIGLVMVLGCGGCLAVTGAFFNEVDKAIEKEEDEDKEPGGPDNPLEIEPGKAFEVYDFEYQAGWSVAKDAFGDVDIRGLRVENNRDDKDGAIVEIKFWKGNEVLALADCTTEQIDVGTITRVSCFSADKLPKAYDKITVNDTF